MVVGSQPPRIPSTRVAALAGSRRAIQEIILSPEKYPNPPSTISISDVEVHIWAVCLDCPEIDRHRYQGTLSTDETGRALRFYFDEDRLRFVTARGAVRAILGLYLQEEPKNIRFEYTRYGKPEVFPRCGLRFNVSHSAGLAVLAITSGQDVGIDAEFIRPVTDFSRIARRFFSQREYQALEVLPAEARLRAFFACWTRKEAFIKAVGEGLSRPLDQFDVSVEPDGGARLESVAGSAQEASRWCMQDLPAIPGFAGTVIARSPCASLRSWRWIH
jgi:4'-phosphopantetheinyl transferase